MKPAAFDFAAPDTLAGVVEVLGEHGEEARVLAGGQSLVPLMNLRMVRPSMLVSINRCAELDHVTLADGALLVGALVRQADAERHALVREHCPLLAAALPHLGGQANRNRGTVCGSIAHADPLAELPAVALALDAEMIVAGRAGERRIAAGDFFLGELATAIGPGELLRAVAFRARQPGERCAFLEVGNRRHGFAVAGVALRWRIADGRCDFARVAAMGAGPTACRVPAAEAALLGSPVDSVAIAAAAAAMQEAVSPPTDVHADAGYRRHVLGVLLRRGLEGEAA
jgi:carbon-monoxide dehydrogenase medium subunit